MAAGEARLERLHQYAQGTRFSAVVLGAAALVLVASIALTSFSIASYRDNLLALERSAHFLTLVHETQSAVAQAQAAQRRYLLIADPAELQRIERARARLDSGLAELHEQAVAYTPQRQRAEILEQLVRQRLALVDATLQRHRTDGPAASLTLIRNGEGQRVMDAITDLVEGIARNEREHVAARRSGTVTSGRTALLGIVAGLGAFLVMFVVGYRVLRRGLEQRNRAQAAVGELNLALDRNADALDRAAQLRAMLSGINHAVVRVRSRQELMREACEVAVRTGRFDLAWAGLVDDATGELRPQVKEGDEAPFLATVIASADSDTPVGKGMVGHALRGRRLVIVNDVERDAPPEYLAVSRHAGYRAAAVVPFIVGERAAGAYMLYSREPDLFDEAVVKLLEDVGAHVSFALSFLQQREAVERLAYYDTLTGLPNAVLFQEQVNALIASPGDPDRRVAVVALGLDRLGEMTESYGPEAGDAALAEVARRLAAWAADEDGVAARLASDTLAYAVMAANENEALIDQALRCLARLGDDPHFVSGQKLRLNVRAGIAYAHDGVEAAAILCVNAQAALRTAREALEPVVNYEPAMNARVAARLALETQLRTSHREHQFALHYQPRFDFESGALTGLEALLRWAPTRGGLVAPADFIPVLEETGLIVDVGRWILERVIADTRMWRALGCTPPRVSINVSGVEVRDARFVDHIARALAAADAWHVDLELTESTVMSDVEENIARLTALRDMGVGIIIDDFGTGYSSLSYLVRLPITEIKIDRSFVVDIATRREQAAVVSTMMSLARTLGLKVIAEGVENEAQAAVLRSLRCDEVQGFLYGRPVAAPDVVALLSGDGLRARA